MDHELIADFYRQMLRIRRFEEESARLYTEKKIGGFLHLYTGQEAVAVGTASVLEDKDYVLTSYRCHGHYLARGGSCGAGFAELLGKETGCAKGRGGSMHFFDAQKRMTGGWGIVGGQVPLAAGIAFGEKYKGTGAVALCFLGDGAINIGPFHEGLCYAALWKLPVVYIIENNYFAMGTPLQKTAATDDLSIRALAYPMARSTIDGHDIFSVRAGVHAAVKRAREHSLPTLIEARTYRYRGHSMADPAKYRTEQELEEWKSRDPLRLMGEKLDGFGLSDLRKKIEDEIETEIKEGLEFAENSNFPKAESVADYVLV